MQKYATCGKYNEEKNCMPQMVAVYLVGHCDNHSHFNDQLVRIDSSKLPHIKKQCVRLLKWPQSPHTYMCGFGLHEQMATQI